MNRSYFSILHILQSAGERKGREDVDTVAYYMGMLRDPDACVVGPRFRAVREPAPIILGGIATSQFDEGLLQYAKSKGVHVFGPSGSIFAYIPYNFYAGDVLLQG